MLAMVLVWLNSQCGINYQPINNIVNVAPEARGMQVSSFAGAVCRSSERCAVIMDRT